VGQQPLDFVAGQVARLGRPTDARPVVTVKVAYRVPFEQSAFDRVSAQAGHDVDDACRCRWCQLGGQPINETPHVCHRELKNPRTALVVSFSNQTTPSDRNIVGTRALHASTSLPVAETDDA
jgi:hypothetical protein